MSESRVITFGCRLNSFESEIIRSHSTFVNSKDVVVINTCAVTAEAERQARQMIRKTRREQPNAKIVVTGCAAQISPEAYASLPEVDQVIGNEEKLKSESFSPYEMRPVLVNEITDARKAKINPITKFPGRSRAFVQVQNGCNHRCTFCIIPYGRGPSRSIPLGEIVSKTRALVNSGYRELVFTGVDISAYGNDLPGKPSLGQALRRILQIVPSLKRLRLSSIDPAEIDSDLIDLIANEPRLMPHIHLSLQSGDDIILKRMKRRHDRSNIIQTCDKLKKLRPGIVFGADIIAGFPTETTPMFNNTVELIKDAGLTWLHVFPYSAREGTPASRMPQIEKNLIRERAAALRGLGTKMENAFLDTQIGRNQRILMESDQIGRSEHFAKVRVTGATVKSGQLLSICPNGREGQILVAEHMK